jgi:hypothetical protein
MFVFFCKHGLILAPAIKSPMSNAVAPLTAGYKSPFLDQLTTNGLLTFPRTRPDVTPQIATSRCRVGGEPPIPWR